MLLVGVGGCSGAPARARQHGRGATRTIAPRSASRRIDPPPYTGRDTNGIPHYARLTLGPDDRALLRRVYGIEDPGRLYVSDSSPDGLLKYDTRVKRCRICYVDSYRVGFISIRRPGESWEALERRVRAMRPRDFPPSARIATASLDALDPAIVDDVRRMLADAARAGYDVHVVATYRTPEREAYLMAAGRGRTHTLTSLHSYGRAIDIVIGDGDIHRPSTRARWIAFRRWVTSWHDGEFRILGTPDRTWDWRHVEIPSAGVGFRTIGDAIARARACTAPRTRVPCDFLPHLRPGA